MKASELVARTLVRLGVARVFGVVGSGNFEITTHLARAGVPFVAARHEAGAATMADAFTRMSGQLAVVTTHQGCGLTNAITGIGEAAKSRTPMLVLTADSPASHLRSNFRIDQESLARSVGAVSDRVYSAATAVADVTRAVRTARVERRTVVLHVAIDVQAQAADVSSPISLETPSRVRPAQASVAALADAIAASERPVFIAGRGGRGAREELTALADTSGALLATSAVAHGLFRDEPFGIGISGGFSSPTTAELIHDADLIVGWGCALNMWTTRHGRLLSEGVKLAQIDDDLSELGANRAIDIGVHADVAAAALDVLAELLSRDASAERYRTPVVARRIAESSRMRQVAFDDLSTAERIDPRTLTIALDDILPADRVVATDSGNFMGYPATLFDVPDELGFCFTQAFQSIGLGLATILGAALAQPHRTAVLGTGDGGFLMAIAELETAVRLSLPLAIVVYNDSAYGAEVHHFAGGEVGVDEGIVTFPEVDVANIARGYGAEGVTVRTLADLEAVGRWVAAGREKPLVIDAKIANDGGSWWLAEAFRGH